MKEVAKGKDGKDRYEDNKGEKNKNVSRSWQNTGYY